MLLVLGDGSSSAHLVASAVPFARKCSDKSTLDAEAYEGTGHRKALRHATTRESSAQRRVHEIAHR